MVRGDQSIPNAEKVSEDSRMERPSPSPSPHGRGDWKGTETDHRTGNHTAMTARPIA